MSEALLALVEAHFGIAANAARGERRGARPGAQADERSALAVVERLVSKETYFFRNPGQFAVLEEWLRDGRPRRLLSVGCSTGEEPLTMAITAIEARGEAARPTVRIDAIDVSERALGRARAAVYRSWSVRSVDDALIRRYFRREGSRWAIDPRASGLVRYARHNALSWLPHAPSYDAVMCRNLLMYMTDEASKSVLGAITSALRPGGLLFLGHAETGRGRRKGLRVERRHGAHFFRRQDESAARCAAPVAASRVPRARPSVRRDTEPVRPLLLLPRTPLSIGRAERRSSTQTQQRTAASGGEPAQVEVDARDQRLPKEPEALAYLAWWSLRRGELEEAHRASARLLELDDLDPIAHHLKALCAEAGGDRAAACEHERRAIYLDPRLAMAHLHLALMALEVHDHGRARRGLTRAVRLFERGAPGPTGAEYDHVALFELCRRELRALEGSS